VYAPTIKDALGLTQTQIATVGSAVNLGGYCAIISGSVYDNLKDHHRLGPRCADAAVLAAMSRLQRAAVHTVHLESLPPHRHPAQAVRRLPLASQHLQEACLVLAHAVVPWSLVCRLVLWMGCLCCFCGYTGLYLMASGKVPNNFAQLLIFAVAAGG
jgi:hypothetical protein